MPKKSTLRRRLRMICAATAAASMPARAFSLTVFWTDFAHDHSWTDDANWDSHTPQGTDSVVIRSSGSNIYSVNYDYPFSVPSLFSLDIDYLNSGGINTLFMPDNFTLIMTEETVGSGSSGAINQSAGLNQITSASSLPVTLYLGEDSGGQGIYTLSGGTLSVSGGPVATEYVGGAGTGTFIQSGGLNTIDSDAASVNLNVASSPGSIGTYFMTGGTLSVANISGPAAVDVGGGGLGAFEQSGGFHKITAGFLRLGSTSVANGSYDLSGSGTLSVAATSNLSTAEYIGYDGTGTFSQSGGENNVVNGVLSIAFDASSQGRYNLSGGTLIVNSGGGEIVGFRGIGTFDQTGGLNQLNSSDLNLGFEELSSGQYTLSAGILAISGGTEDVGFLGVGQFNQSGGRNSLTNGAGLLVSSGGLSSGSYTLSAVGTLTADSSNEYIGIAGHGNFVQTGGLNQITNGELALGGGLGSVGTYTLSGTGSLSAQNIEIGGAKGTAAGAGVLTVSAANLTVSSTGTLTVYNSAGNSLNLNGGKVSAGKLDLSGNLNLLNWTTGTLVLTNSLHPVVFDDIGSDNLAATLTLVKNQTFQVIGREVVGETDVGSLNLSGGVNTVTIQGLVLGDNQGATGTYVISNSGTLSVQNLYIGGSTTGSGGVGFLTVSSGTVIAAASEYVGYNGQGTFNQIGGSNTFGNSPGPLNVAYEAGSTGNYTLGRIAVLTLAGGDENVGRDGAGTFDQIGGLNTGASILTVGVLNQGIGTYTMIAGTLSADSEVLGQNALATGSFVQSGGLNTTGGLTLGENAGAFGAYTLGMSGVLTCVSGFEFVGMSGTGDFEQNGGTNQLTGTVQNSAGDLDLGELHGATGTYTLSGTGTLSASKVNVGGTSGAAGGMGTMTVMDTAAMNVTTLKVYAGNGSSLNVQGGRVSVHTLNLFGAYNQSGGAATIFKITGSGQANISGGLTVLAFNGGASLLNGLVISGTGTLDLTNNSLAINFGSPANDPVAAIAQNLTSGYAGGAWTGAGIRSSIAAAGTPGQTLSVGYADGNTDFGTAAQANQVLVKYTLAADANLDGLVNFNDLVAVVQNFNKVGADWAQGDFHYGTSTNFNDLVAVVQNFNKTLTPAGSSGDQLGGTTISLAAPFQSQINVVPEPAALGLFAASGILLTRRRRQRRAGTF